MVEVKIRPKVRLGIIRALSAGVVPGIGLQHIQVGRAAEVKAIIKSLDEISDGGSVFKLVVGDYGAGKTFFLHLVRKLAAEKKMVTVLADFSPERRLVASGGQARALYSELITSMATRSRPEGNGLVGIIEAFIMKSISDAKEKEIPVLELIASRLSTLQDMVSGWDFAKVIAAYCRGYQESNDELKQSAIRWLRGEYTSKIEARKSLDVRTIIDDSLVYDALKLMKCFVRIAGYDGMLVILDEAVNLFKITHGQSRTSNYEMVLRILNDTLQQGYGVDGLGVLIGITPEAVFDSRRGLCSYDALSSRITQNTFAKKTGLVDMNQPTIHLQSLTPEELYLLLANIRAVFESGLDGRKLIDDDGIKSFMEHCNKTIGASYFKTPRDSVREFANLMSMLEAYEDKTLADFISEAEESPTSTSEESASNDLAEFTMGADEEQA